MLARKHGGLWIEPHFVEALRGAGLDSFEALMRTPGDRELSKPSLPSWRQRLAITAGPHRFFLKRFHDPPLREQLPQRLRGFGSTAEVEGYWLSYCERLGVPAPRPVAVGSRRRALREHESVLLMTAVSGEALDRLVGQGGGPLADAILRRRIADGVARWVRTLHRAGLFHRDLYLSHVFLGETEPTPQLALIDLQRVVRPRVFRRRWLIKDLAAVNYSAPSSVVSRTDRLRWYRAYADRSRLSPSDKVLLRSVEAKTRRIARHTARHEL